MDIFQRAKGDTGYWRTEKYLVRSNHEDERGRFPVFGIRWSPGRNGRRRNEQVLTLFGPVAFIERMEEVINSWSAIREGLVEGERSLSSVNCWRYVVGAVEEAEWRMILSQLVVDWSLEAVKGFGRMTG